MLLTSNTCFGSMIVTLIAFFTVFSLIETKNLGQGNGMANTENLSPNKRFNKSSYISFVTGDLQKSQTTTGLRYVVEQSQQNFKSSSLADTATCTW